jgi:hypothetical protein
MGEILRSVEAPALPLGPAEYVRSYQDQLNSIQRLFYNRLTNAINPVIGPNGGQYVDCPNALFFNTDDQYFAATNTPYPVEFNQTYLHNAIDLVSSTRAVIKIGGVYNFQYSGQLKGTNASSKSVWIWIRRNGVDIGYSTRAYTSTLNNEYKSIDWNFNIDMAIDDYLELVIAVSDTSVYLAAEAPTSPHPGISSSVLTINFIAPLPAVRPTPPSP